MKVRAFQILLVLSLTLMSWQVDAAENLARGKPARMQCHFGGAFSGAEGATDGELADNDANTVVTCWTDYPWLCIDLGEERTVTSVKFFNRKYPEHVSPRMDGLFVGFPPVCPSEGEAVNPGLYQQCGIGPVAKASEWSTVNCPESSTARYVMIQSKLTNEFLNLIEVQVLGSSAPESAKNQGNIAAGKSATMKCLMGSQFGSATEATDGDYRDYGDKAVVATCITDYAWLCIDLGETRTVNEVRVLNRDSQPNVWPRMTGFHVGFPDNCPNDLQNIPVDFGRYTLCGLAPNHVYEGKLTRVKCDKQYQARYVIIQSRFSQDLLNLIEVEVIGPGGCAGFDDTCSAQGCCNGLECKSGRCVMPDPCASSPCTDDVRFRSVCTYEAKNRYSCQCEEGMSELGDTACVVAIAPG